MLTVVDDKLVVEAKGIYSVEKFLVARRLMYWQVYLHKTSVAAEQMLIKILSRAKYLSTPDSLTSLNSISPALRYFLTREVDKATFNDNDLEQYAMLDDSDILAAIKVWSESDDIILRTLCKSFSNRQLFKTKLLDAPFSDEEINLLKQRYAKELNLKQTADADYLFSLHTTSKDTYNPLDDSIAILYKDGTIKDISQASDMLNLSVLTKKVKKHYLFYLP